MDFFGVLQLIGGLCMFLFGMDTMGSGLTRASGSKLEQILENLTSSIPKGGIVGMCGYCCYTKFICNDCNAGRFC